MVAIDDKLCKLQMNDAKKLRHHWQSEKNKCDCGCINRIFVNSRWICEEHLREELNKLGYSFEKNFINGSVGGVSSAKN